MTSSTIGHQAPLSMGILQAGILEWVAMPFYRESSQATDRTQVSALQVGSLLSEPPAKPSYTPSVSSVTQSCLTLFNPMDCSMPGLPVHYQLPELAQTHVQRVGDAIQPSHPLSSPSPPVFNFPSIRVFSNESVLHIR